MGGELEDEDRVKREGGGGGGGLDEEKAVCTVMGGQRK